MTNNFIIESVKEAGIDDVGFTYLVSVVAANMSLSVVNSLENAKFRMELEEYQKSGGTE